MIIQSAALSHSGKVREQNEDNLFFDGAYVKDPSNREDFFELEKDTDYCTFAVCDGMGGEKYGEEASLMAVTALAEFDSADISQNINAFIEKANNQICDEMKARRVNQMGCTVAMLAFHDDRVTACNIGDSRIYLFDDNSLMQISEDHRSESVAGRSGVLTQHLGVKPEEFILEPYVVDDIDVRPGMLFLICSDGITDMVLDTKIEELVSKYREKKPLEIAVELVTAAMVNGGRDNATIIVIKILGERGSENR